MSAEESISLIFVTLGGLALFLFGINLMTAGLRAVAGEKLRGALALANRNRLAGFSLGTALGFLIHSSAASAMTVGLVNAGLIRLAGSLPILFGANVGTTLSMQVISLQLTDLAFFAIALGFALIMAPQRAGMRGAGQAVMGIGILFLGMELMSGAIEPHQETLRPWLERIDGGTWNGLLAGIAGAALVTAIIQSSGATIGMCFVLISAGVFTSLEQVYPIVLGAHVGTSATALLASIGVGMEARRAALGNLFFNLFNTALAAAAAPLFFKIIPLTADSLVHQTANLHTAVMAVAALLLLPFPTRCARLIERLTPSKQPETPGTHLDRQLIDTPEDGLRAAIDELGRCAGLCRQSLTLARELLYGADKRKTRTIRRNEDAVNQIKAAFKNYLSALARRQLSRRQALLAKYLNNIIDDVERIGDHIEHLASLSSRLGRPGKNAPLAGENGRRLQEVHEKAAEVLEALEKALNVNAGDDAFNQGAALIIAARDAYIETSARVRERLDDRVAGHEITPTAGLLLSEYVLTCDRMVRHCRTIAAEQQQPFFRLKERKRGRYAAPLEPDE